MEIYYGLQKEGKNSIVRTVRVVGMKARSFRVFIQKEPVLSIALVLAFFSLFLVPPNIGYSEYIDWKTLGCLFALMLVVAGFRKMFVFTKLSSILLHYSHTPRQVSLILVGITFFSSMLVTNDVALITFVPLTIVVFTVCKETKPILFTIVLQTLAANVGSSLTPVGNPQNLFMYSYYHVSLSSFFSTMLPYVFSGGFLIALLLLFIPKRSESFSLQVQEVPPIHTGNLIRYSFLFLLSLLAVFDLVPWPIVVLLVIIGSEKVLLKEVDYSLLLTFIGFFIFVGNIGQLKQVTNSLTKLLETREFIVSLLASQLISNVPATLLLAQFTDNATELLKGVNAGGCGTLIASMASVISFKIFAHYDPKRSLAYLGLFTLVNILFVILFLLIHRFW
ncbi:SLC13 family permease [Sphaerochaeta globosa]|uniref:Citrate transporter n=1 Tax=Sphaerochaeta globosa (strain ATCC BAA-1886 / DSM 22777 / Buddy) TaxID=158189 RepID=F0RZ31_SPHGB|nr:SLC13 family permease [Sphaerochaeta globosa]ADY13238.1 Citrate transporter [Sphaerochaeta globosa str. Buddy]